MATWEDVSRLAGELPETETSTSYGHASWTVSGKNFVWERPLSKKDRALLGDTAPPDDVIVAVMVGGLDEKEAVLAANPGCCFTTPHFNGYPAVLIRLDEIHEPLLAELVTDGWLAKAPVPLVRDWQAAQPPP